MSPTSLSIKKKGSKDEQITVTAPSSCAWTAVTDVGWISINKGDSGTGNGTVTLSIEKNNAHPREGSVTVAGHVVTVTQGEAD